MPAARLDATATEVLAATPAALRTLLRGAPAVALETPIDEGWSVKDVVAHLLDAQGVAFAERIRRILAEDRPRIRPIDPSARLRERAYASWPLERLLDEFERTRAEDIELLRSLSRGQLDRAGEHEQAGDVTVSNLAHYCAVHDMTHLAQIARMLQAQLLEHAGGMAMFVDE
jgi:hypothetical protein